MTSRGYLVDTSVLGRAQQGLVGDRLEELALSGRLWTCGLIDLEVIYGSRSRDVTAVVEERRSLPRAPITEAVLNRSVRLAQMLAEHDYHRGAKPVDLVIAAAAEASHLTILHYDDDYERIAAVSNQPTEWVSPPGGID